MTESQGLDKVAGKEEISRSVGSLGVDSLVVSQGGSSQDVSNPKMLFKEEQTALESNSENNLQGMTMDEKRFAADQQAHLPHVEGAQLWILIAV